MRITTRRRVGRLTSVNPAAAKMLDYYKAIHRELVSSGELVDSQVPTGPNLAKIVTSDGLTPSGRTASIWRRDR